jgi:putative transposase
MIISVCVNLNEIFSQGRKFKWVKPCNCPRCGSVRLWGHGFVLAYFDGFTHGLLLRRFRCPEKRGDRGKTRKFDDETIAIILNERRKSLHLPVPLFLASLKNQCLVPQTTGLSTIYRLLHQHELMQHTTAPEDRRKFEARLPNDIRQSDVMHGPKVSVDQKHRKTYLIAFIDDHSRLIVQGAFYLSENLFSFMDAFEKALAKRGLPRKLYVDNGAAFRSHKLAFTCASLAVSLVPYLL